MPVLSFVLLSQTAVPGLADQLSIRDLMLFMYMDTPGKGRGDPKDPVLLWDDIMIEAIKQGNKEQVGRLLDKGNGPNARSKNGGAALRWAAVYGHKEIVLLLLDSGAELNMEEGGQREEELIRAAIRGDRKGVEASLSGGADIHAKSEQGDTALHWASVMGHVQVVSLLIDRGADVNAINKKSCPPLFLAAQNGHEEAAKLLLARAANRNVRSLSEDKQKVALQELYVKLRRLLAVRGLVMESPQKTRQDPRSPDMSANNHLQDPPGLKWKIKVGGVSSPIVVSHGLVIFFPENSCLTAVDVQKGRQRWKIPNSWQFDLTFANGLLFFREGRPIYAADARTGQQKWKQDFWTYGRIFVTDGVLITETADGFVCGLDAETGEVKWTYVRGHRLLRPTVGDGMVFVTASENYFLGLDYKTGRQIWEYKPEGYSLNSFITVLAGTMYFGGSEGDSTFCAALDVKTGREKWKAPCEMLCASPTLERGVCLFPASENLYALDSDTGRQKWKSRTNDLYITPVIADGRVYFRDRDKFYALDLETGQVKWSISMGFPAQTYSHGGVAVADGVAYVGTNDGFLYAIDTQVAEQRQEGK